MANTDSRGRDLDETRRLLYMALVVGQTKRYNLAGTLINALRHHQGIDDPDLEDKILRQVEGTENDSDDTWVRTQISRITSELAAESA